MEPAIRKPTPLTKRGTATKEELALHIYSRFKSLRQKRLTVDSKWDIMYAMYRANADDMTVVQRASFSTGSRKQWKDRRAHV